MQIVTVPLPQLGNRCHLLHDGNQGIVVDPPRDHTVVESAADEAGVEIRAVADTHVHNDYVSGAPLLARRHGADYLVAAAEGVAVPHVGVRSGDVVDVGGLAVEVLHAPGHTEHHQAFLVGDGAGPAALLSGGSLLHGTVGRTDLVAPDRTADLARAQWSTARRLAELPRRTVLLPTHGFGSFSRRVASQDDSGTVSEEHLVGPALTLDLGTFVSDLLASGRYRPSTGTWPASTGRCGGLSRPPPCGSRSRPPPTRCSRPVGSSTSGSAGSTPTATSPAASTSSTATGSRRTSAGWCPGGRSSCCWPTTRPG